MSEASIRCPKCYKPMASTSAKECPYCGNSIKYSDNKGFLTIVCYAIGIIMLAVGTYMTFKFFDFVKFKIILGAIASSVIFFSLGKALDYLKQILNKH